MGAIEVIEKGQTVERPGMRSGDTVRVHVRVREGDKERIQVYAGTVIARDGRGSTETFTVRRISYGVGVERVFPMHSPRIEKIEILRYGKVRRAKLYYIREKIGKKAKIKELLGGRKPPVRSQAAQV